MTNNHRLIEDYFPIEAISAEARIENNVTQARSYLSKVLLSILHHWLTRCPLVSCRATTCAALVPLVAETLVGPGLNNSVGEMKVLVATTSSEHAALGKLLINWRAVVDQPVIDEPLFEYHR